jgi:hypothetical protein
MTVISRIRLVFRIRIKVIQSHNTGSSHFKIRNSATGTVPYRTYSPRSQTRLQRWTTVDRNSDSSKRKLLQAVRLLFVPWRLWQLLSKTTAFATVTSVMSSAQVKLVLRPTNFKLFRDEKKIVKPRLGFLLYNRPGPFLSRARFRSYGKH